MKPKFCVGELVNVRSAVDSSVDIDCVEIIGLRPSDDAPIKGGGRFSGMGYKLSHDDDHYFMEQSLRKRPPDESNSFSAIMSKLKQPAKA